MRSFRRRNCLARLRADHPEVKAATLAVEEVRRQLSAEVNIVVHNLENDLKISSALLKTLEGQYAELDGRLKEVSGFRATYSNQLGAVRQRSENLARVIKDLADVLRQSGRTAVGQFDRAARRATARKQSRGAELLDDCNGRFWWRVDLRVGTGVPHGPVG